MNEWIASIKCHKAKYPDSDCLINKWANEQYWQLPRARYTNNQLTLKWVQHPEPSNKLQIASILNFSFLSEYLSSRNQVTVMINKSSQGYGERG